MNRRCGASQLTPTPLTCKAVADGTWIPRGCEVRRDAPFWHSWKLANHATSLPTATIKNRSWVDFFLHMGERDGGGGYWFWIRGDDMNEQKTTKTTVLKPASTEIASQSVQNINHVPYDILSKNYVADFPLFSWKQKRGKRGKNS